MKRRLEDLESHYDTRLPVVVDKHWRLQIRHYTANTLFASLKFIHSNSQLDDLADPFSIGIPVQSILKLTRGQCYHSGWLTKMMWLVASRGREAMFRRVSQESSKVGYQF